MTARSAVTSTAYVYPWDLVGDPAAAQRLADLGTDSVTVAAAYHSVRAATPSHPHHRIVDAESAALYVPVRPAAWQGSRLHPTSGAGWAGDDSFALARDQLADVGLPTEAWIVVTHGSALGAQAPELCVTNAFGDVYGYALCPNNPDVVEYAATLVGEVVEAAAVGRITVEACGPLGVGHQSRHEKTAGAEWTPEQELLLSLCFCARCRQDYDGAGLDVGELADAVALGIGPDVSGRSPQTAADGRAKIAIAGADEIVLDTRRRSIRTLRDAVIEAARARGVDGIAFHAAADPWATGPAAGVALDDDGGGATTLIAHCWSAGLASVESVRELAAVAGAAAVGAYCTILPPTEARADDLAEHWRSVVAAGASELHLYHAGLASVRRLAAARDALRILRADGVMPPSTEPTVPADRAGRHADQEHSA